MATVRFSQELRTTIMNNARLMFINKISTIRSRPVPSEWTGDAIYNAIFGEWRTHMEALPVEFFHQFDSITVRSVGNLMVRTGFRLTTKRSFPSGHAHSNFLTRASYGGVNEFDLKDHPDSPFKSLLDHYKQIQREVDVLEAQTLTFTTGVQKLLHAHATLAPALKAWPALWDLLPESAKDKHRLVANKVNTEKPDLDGVDVAALTATVVMNKLGV